MASSPVMPVELRRQRGQALVELALVLPVMLVIIIGLIDYGNAYAQGVAIQQGAREAARMGSLVALDTNVKAQQLVTRLVDASKPLELTCTAIATGAATPTTTCTDPQGTTWTVTITVTNAAGSTINSQASWTQARSGRVKVTATGNVPIITGAATRWIGIETISLRGDATMPIF